MADQNVFSNDGSFLNRFKASKDDDIQLSRQKDYNLWVDYHNKLKNRP